MPKTTLALAQIYLYVYVSYIDNLKKFPILMEFGTSVESNISDFKIENQDDEICKGGVVEYLNFQKILVFWNLYKKNTQFWFQPRYRTWKTNNLVF